MGDELQDSIVNTLYRWDNLERKLGSAGFAIIDMDLSKNQPERGELGQFEDRYSALKSLDSLQDKLAAANADQFVNKEALILKLRGCEALLRTLLGERIGFSDYVNATMALTPPSDWQAELKFIEDRILGDGSLGNLETTIRSICAAPPIPVAEFVTLFQDYVKKFEPVGQKLLDLKEKVAYSIELESVDAYWKCWIDSPQPGALRIRVNTHPNHSYSPYAASSLAAHEVVGHALNFTTIGSAVANGKIDRASAIITNFTHESFQLEGLAQNLHYFVAGQGLVDSRALARELIFIRRLAVANLLQEQLERGVSARSVYQQLEELCSIYPKERDEIASDLRGRALNPIFKVYTYCYFHAWKTFRNLLEHLGDRSEEFLRANYSTVLTPSQINAWWRTIDG